MARQAVVFLALLQGATGLRERRHSAAAPPISSSVWDVIPPPSASGKHVGVIMNPGGAVPSEKYVEPMRLWQVEAQKRGISMWVSVLNYWFSLPLPFNMKKNVRNAVKEMQKFGMPNETVMYFAGHSMGGGASQPQQMELVPEIPLSGSILLGSYITRPFFPPVTSELTYSVPTLTVGAELNFGAARIPRMAEAVYRQAGMVSTHPVVVVEGMNHMQFADGLKKDDLKPEVSDADAQQEVARLSVDFIAKMLGLSDGQYLTSQVVRTKALVTPLIEAAKLEGARGYNVPNQPGTPNWDCTRGVCPGSSQWVVQAQELILGKSKSGVKVLNNFADLNPFSLAEREGRKPFIDQSNNMPVVQTYVMAAGKEDDFTGDTANPKSTGELLAKFISRQNGDVTLRKSDPGDDPDFCVQINKMAFDYALRTSPEKARLRFLKYGQPLKFVPTVYRTIGPQWVLSNLVWKEDASGAMTVQSFGLFTSPGPRAIDGNHYCKLLSPAMAMEWIMVDGLTKNLFATW